MTTTITYEAKVRVDAENGSGYIAVSTTRAIGRVVLTDWAWTGYGATPEAALAALEGRLRDVHQAPCQPRRIVYDLDRLS